MGLDKLQEKAVVRIIDDDDSMRKSWRFLIEGEGWDNEVLLLGAPISGRRRP